MFETIANHVARGARSANPLITHVQCDASANLHRLANTGDLVLKAGRPVLVAASAATQLYLDHVLIAWKDTREARRAVIVALPLLKKAARVSIVELVDSSELGDAKIRVDNVCHRLREQAINAESTLPTPHWSIKKNR